MFQQAYYKLLPLVSVSFSSHAMPYGLRENCAAMVLAVFQISRLLLLLREFLPLVVGECWYARFLPQRTALATQYRREMYPSNLCLGGCLTAVYPTPQCQRLFLSWESAIAVEFLHSCVRDGRCSWYRAVRLFLFSQHFLVLWAIKAFARLLINIDVLSLNTYLFQGNLLSIFFLILAAHTDISIYAQIKILLFVIFS